MVGLETPAELTTHLTTGAVVVYLVEWLKHQSWCRWLTADTSTVNRVVSGVAAAAVAFGVTWTGDADTGWTIHVPMLTALVSGLWEWAKQWTLQQVLYDAAIKKPQVVVVNKGE